MMADKGDEDMLPYKPKVSSQFEVTTFQPSSAPSTSGNTAGSAASADVASGSVKSGHTGVILVPNIGGEETVSVCSDGNPDMSDAMNCVICMDTIDSPYVTKCGHSYCYACINSYISNRGKCPKCNTHLQTIDILPNHSLAEIISVYKQAERENKQSLSSMLSNLNDLFGSEEKGMSKRMKLDEVQSALHILTGLKNNLESTHRNEQLMLVKEILQRKLQALSSEFEELKLKYVLMQSDVKFLEDEVSGAPCSDIKSSDLSFQPAVSAGASETGIDDSARCQGKLRRENMVKYYDELISEYFAMRMNDVSRKGQSNASAAAVASGVRDEISAEAPARDLSTGEVDNTDPHMEVPVSPPEAALSTTPPSSGKARVDTATPATVTDAATRMPDGLERFTKCVSKMSKYLYAKDIATVSYKQRMFAHTSHIVSSIDFNSEQEYFAVAGVTKKIKIFDYGIVAGGLHEYHVPNAELTNSSKLSCVIFSRYFNNWLVSGDYDGRVILWDVTSNSKTTTFMDHQKRCWSVDINHLEPRLMISGGDDGRVVLYHMQQAKSIARLDYKANVCCVQFSPTSQHEFIFGTADHCIHYYDIRSLKKSIATLKEHSKAVSYVKFMGSKHVMSASTDSQLRLWNLNKLACERVFEGHANEKNFVGLTCTEDYAACGSEDNSVYLYYKGFSKPILNHALTNPPRSFFELAPKTEAGDFISAVCWKENSDVVLAGNSTGTVKVFQLVTEE